MAKLDDLISQIRSSRIGKAVSNLDQDKTKPGFQLRKPLISPIPDNQIQRPKNFIQRGISNVAQSFREDPGQYSFTRAFSNVVPATQIAFSPINYLKGQAPSQTAKDISYGLRGATQLTPFQAVNSLGIDKKGQQLYQQGAPTTEREKKAQQLGRTAYGLALTAPIGGQGYAVNTFKHIAAPTIGGAILSPVINAAGTLATQGRLPTKEESMKAAQTGAYQGFTSSPYLAVTNPLTSKAVNSIGGSFLQKQILKRLTGGVANVLEDSLLAKVDGLDRTTHDQLLSFGIGAVITGNDELLDEFKTKMRGLGVTEEATKEVITKAKNKIPDPRKIMVKTTEIDPKTGKRIEMTLDEWNKKHGQSGFARLGPDVAQDPLESLKNEARKYKSAEEFVKAQAVKAQLIEDGTKINPDGTVTLYHVTTPEIAAKIKKEGMFKASSAPVGGMTGVNIEKASFFGTDPKWVKDTWGSGREEMIEVNVPAEYIRKGALNKLEVYFENGLKKQGNKWVPVTPPQSTFYDRIPEQTLIDKQQLTDIYNSVAQPPISDMPLYHGTTKQFDSFDLSKAGTRNPADQGFAGKGIYLSNSKEVAETFASGKDIFKTKGTTGPGRIIETRLDPKAKVLEVSSYGELQERLGLQKPDFFSMRNNPSQQAKARSSFADAIRNKAKQMGYDAIKVDGGGVDKYGTKTFEMVVFDPKNITISPQPPKGVLGKIKSTLTDQSGFARLGPEATDATGKTLQQDIQAERLKSATRAVNELPSTTAKPGSGQSAAQTGQKVKSQAQESLDDIISDAHKEIGSLEDEPKKSISQTARDIYTQWVNRFAPVERAGSVAKNKLKTQGAELRPEYDPEYLIRRFTGAGGIATARFERELKPIIDTLDEAGISKLDMDAYLKAKRDIGLGDRNILGSDTNLATKRVIALAAKNPQIEEIAQMLYKYQNEGFQEMIDAGFLSKDAADIIRQQNPDYVPFQRVMDEVDNYLGVPSNKLQQGTSPIQKIKGSEKQIYSPIESVIANTFKQRAAIEKNRVASSIIKLNEIAPELGFEKVSKSAPDTITVWEGGEKQYWKVGKEIADTVKGVNEETTNTLLKIFKAPASLLRQGATGRNPDFLVPNVVKDQFDAAISSKYGYIPFVDYFSGLKSMLMNDEIYQKWENSGAKIDIGELSGRKSIQASFDQAAQKKNLLQWIGAGLDVLGKYSEQPTRVGLFKKAYAKTGNELLSVMESRDATVDFARMGSKMKVANSIIPFLNVGIQGFDKIMRNAKNDPAKLALNAAIYGSIPAISTTLYNLVNYPQEYSEIPQYDKDSNFIFVTGRNKEGTVDYLKIPKGNIVPLIANPVENLLNYAYGQSKETIQEMATKLISSSLPVLGEGSSIKEVATKTIGQNLPQLIKPPIEGLLNRSFYKYDPKKEESKQIVPDYLKKREPYLQAYDWTPKTYKVIGAALNVSPLSVQHYLESYLAGYTKVPSQIVGILDSVSNGNKLDKNNIPILRRFMSTTLQSNAGVPVVKPELPKTGFMERITGKAKASSELPKGRITSQLRDNIKERVKYGNEVSDSELEAAYLGKPLYMPKSNRYEKGERDSELWSASGSIQADENLSDAQKTALQTKIASELGVTEKELSTYQVAKQDNNQKTLYALDQFDTFKSVDEMMRFLVQGRKPINGKILVSDGVIDNLVSDGLITKELGRELKNLDLDQKGQPKKKTSSGSSSKVKAARDKYFKALSNISPAGKKIKTTPPIKINVSDLTFGG